MVLGVVLWLFKLKGGKENLYCSEIALKRAFSILLLLLLIQSGSAVMDCSLGCAVEMSPHFMMLLIFCAEMVLAGSLTSGFGLFSDCQKYFYKAV